jgi:peptide/nickel transport system substrate-binding protein
MDTRSTPQTMGMAQAIQQTFALAGVKLEILPADFRQVLTKYRARQHDIFIGNWGSDYQDPNSNADTFAANDDNSDNAKAKPLAWRNAWDPGPLTQKTRAAVLERDTEKRAAMYDELQRAVMENSPFVIMFQQIEPVALRKNVEGFIVGPSFDTNLYTKARKN